MARTPRHTSTHSAVAISNSVRVDKATDAFAGEDPGACCHASGGGGGAGEIGVYPYAGG